MKNVSKDLTINELKEFILSGKVRDIDWRTCKLLNIDEIQEMLFEAERKFQGQEIQTDVFIGKNKKIKTTIRLFSQEDETEYNLYANIIIIDGNEGFIQRYIKKDDKFALLDSLRAVKMSSKDMPTEILGQEIMPGGIIRTFNSTKKRFRPIIITTFELEDGTVINVHHLSPEVITINVFTAEGKYSISATKFGDFGTLNFKAKEYTGEKPTKKFATKLAKDVAAKTNAVDKIIEDKINSLKSGSQMQ